MEVVLETKPCPSCRKTQQLAVDSEGLARWKSGELIQRALPDLNRSERELLVSGFCDQCWERMFDEDSQ